MIPRAVLEPLVSVHPVPHPGAVPAALPGAGTVVGREDDEGALRGGEDVRPALRPRALFEQDELTALEVEPAAGDDRQHLEGEEHLAVEVLVQAFQSPSP
jgi:hypothetical protein